MTLDEAIKHAEEVVEEQDKLCKRYDVASGYTRSHNEDLRSPNAKKCAKSAEEHRQIAEWLKDYKRLKEQKPALDEIRAEIEQITDTMGVSYNQYVSKIDVLQIIDKYRE